MEKALLEQDLEMIFHGLNYIFEDINGHEENA